MESHPSLDTTQPAPVTFEDIAAVDGATPHYDYGTHTCSGTYCHGTTISGGSLTAPQWLAVGENQAVCGTCHGIPPTENHPDDLACANCHGQVVDAGLNFVAPELHVDGQVESVGTACNACHGSSANPAPPVDTQGRSDTSLMSVGAHQSHLAASNWHAPVPCAACHPVPAVWSAPPHLDGTVEVTFSAPANANGATTSFDSTSGQCTNWCHGPKPSDPAATLTTPVWTAVGQGEAACGTCHGLPPNDAIHAGQTRCQDCHGTVYDGHIADVTDFSNIVRPDLHINGVVNF